MPLDFDAHATTPADPRVIAAMLPFFRERHGNASSSHARGKAAAAALDQARAQVAAVAGCEPGEVVFTSGATEANNLAVVGSAIARGGTLHVVSQPTEHSSVLGALEVVRQMGGSITFLQVDGEGRVDPTELREVLRRRPSVRLVSVMLGNNEVGTVQPVGELLAVCREAGALLHTDASQAFGRVPLGECPSLVTVSGHKIYGPQGIGALIVRRGVPLVPILGGGSHEGGLSPGTPNLPGAVGLGVACEILRREPVAEEEAQRRDRLARKLAELLPADRWRVNGPLEGRLPHNFHATLLGVCPGELLKALGDHVLVSSAAACRGPGSRSHVLDAMGAPGADVGAPVRFGVSRWTSAADVDAAARIVAQAAERLYGQACEVKR